MKRLKMGLGSVRKTVKKFKTAIGFAMAGILTAGVMFCSAPKVKASAGQLNSVVTVSVPSLLQTNNGAFTNTTGTPFVLPTGSDIIIQTTLTPTAALGTATANWLGGFDFTVDGTTYTTTHPLYITNNFSIYSNTPATFITYVNRTNFTGCSQAIFDFVSTPATNNISVSIKIGSVIP